MAENITSLEHRVAINFEELTPRPNLQIYEEMAGIRLDKKLSTRQQIDDLIQYISKN